MNRTVKRTTTIETKTELRISAADIIAAFKLPEGTILTVAVPSWSSGEDLEIDGREQAIVATSKTVEEKEDRMKDCDIREATHVKVRGRYEKIVTKHGVHKDGRLAKPSEGGFWVTTETGENVSMWSAQRYGKETE